ncbi:unnamed protein product [Candida verbasci]|uniref:PCI domain-containing protein n=1 Tax=Candida verbasci TaxID=1227364 RepID=A0A9W4TUD6_9ASCO|nr:unnamed protein product [Candida verbasci]
MSQDVEMNDVEKSTNNNTDQSYDLIKDIESSFSLLNKASTTFDNRYISKLFRELGPLRKQLVKHEQVLPTVISEQYPNSHQSKQILLNLLPTPISTTTKEIDSKLIPEIELYLVLLTQVYLLDTNQLSNANDLIPHIINLMKSFNKRSLDFLQSKLWFFISRTKELISDLSSIRPELLYSLRTATLRHDNETQASIITLLLRNYLILHDIQQSINLIEKIEFPEHAVSNSLICRFYYYLAKINSIQLDYSMAHEYVIAAIRKVPQTKLANGFIQAATKLQIVIDLLMGDLPELKVFGGGNLQPYYNVTKAVKYGDLKLFESVLKSYESDFKKDDLYTLIIRLRQNVIKTGIRLISLSYSKISLKDICIKLHLDSEESTEYIVSKCIRDGVIEASINHEFGYMHSNEILDIYSTKLPQSEFDQRIKFCLSLHNESVKSMRYPNDQEKSKFNNKEIEPNDEMELLKAIEDGDLDDFMD